MDDKGKKVRAGYNQCSRHYADNRDMFKSQRYLDDLETRLPVGARILDVGCGSGVPVDKYLFERGYQVTGIDISEEMIKLARESLPKGNFQVVEMTAVTFPEHSFQAIVSFYAIFHIPREEHLPLLTRLYKLLAPDGYLLITMGTDEWEGTEDDFHGTTMYWSHFGVDKNVELVRQAGFEIIYTKIDTAGGEEHLVAFARKASHVNIAGNAT